MATIEFLWFGDSLAGTLVSYYSQYMKCFQIFKSIVSNFSVTLIMIPILSRYI